MPNFSNSHTRCLTTGLAMHNRQCYYASGAGPAGACESIWASLIGSKSTVFVNELHGALGFNFGGIPGTYRKYASLPNCIYKHFVILTPAENAIMLIDPKAAAASENDNAARRIQRMPQVYHEFFIWLSKNADIGVQKHWVSEIWLTSREQSPNAITPMQTYGDCVGGWVINPAWQWVDHISRLMRIGRLTIKEE